MKDGIKQKKQKYGRQKNSTLPIILRNTIQHGTTKKCAINKSNVSPEHSVPLHITHSQNSFSHRGAGRWLFMPHLLKGSYDGADFTTNLLITLSNDNYSPTSS